MIRSRASGTRRSAKPARKAAMSSLAASTWLATRTVRSMNENSPPSVHGDGHSTNFGAKSLDRETADEQGQQHERHCGTYDQGDEHDPEPVAQTAHLADRIDFSRPDVGRGLEPLHDRDDRASCRRHQKDGVVEDRVPVVHPLAPPLGRGRDHPEEQEQQRQHPDEAHPHASGPAVALAGECVNQLQFLEQALGLPRQQSRVGGVRRCVRVRAGGGCARRRGGVRRGSSGTEPVALA